MELFPISNKNIFCNVTLKKLECRFVGFHGQIVIGIIYAAGYIRVFYKLVGLKLYPLLIYDFGVNDIATVLTEVQGGRGPRCLFLHQSTNTLHAMPLHKECYSRR